jgi:hypothetical protein
MFGDRESTDVGVLASGRESDPRVWTDLRTGDEPPETDGGPVGRSRSGRTDGQTDSKIPPQRPVM